MGELVNTLPERAEDPEVYRVRLSDAMRLSQKALFKTAFQQLSGICCPQLFHHVGAMRLDGLVTNPQLFSNLAIFEAVPNEIENLLLPLR